ncbi:gp15' E', partial [Burkholderia phage BcepB1A]|uniref:gp15' E' n=1 Tax=Burkholderia phage BcepB1A TaxID=279530 RepID=UPI000053EA5A
FFRERQSVRFPRFAGGEGPSIDHVNVDGFIACIVEEGLATLRELQTVYCLEDALDMWEIIMVKRTNERLASEAADKRSRR